MIWKPIIARAGEIPAISARSPRCVSCSTARRRAADPEHYKRLSELTAQGRRDGAFPALIDMTTDSRAARLDQRSRRTRWLRDQFCLDRVVKEMPLDGSASTGDPLLAYV
jgi:hypothetical protein